METRKITVISSTTQSRKELMSNATTLGELRAELLNVGIESTGMAFLEGRSKTELLVDDAILPTNVPDKNGNPTNELVFLITTAQKKIASGLTRAECYDFITTNNLNKPIKDIYGYSFTNLPTQTLESYIDSWKTTQIASSHNSEDSSINSFMTWVKNNKEFSEREKQFIFYALNEYLKESNKEEDLLALFNGLI